MPVRPDRRRILGQGLALGALAAAAGLVRTADAAARTAGFERSALADGVELLRGPGGNCVRVQTREGAVLVDGGPPSAARDLLREVRSDGSAVALLVNTHWHPHSTGCNLLLGKAGVPILAHEFTRLWLQRPIVKVLEGEHHEALPREAWPTRSFREQEQLEIGGRRLELGHLFQAHTDGDCYVRLPDANVIVAGGTVAVGHYPILDTFTGGWIRGMLAATRTLIGLSDDATRIVGESGPPIGRDHLEAQAEMLETLTERLWQLMRKGLSEEDLVAAAPTREYDDRWGDPRDFIRNTYRGIWGHVREMRGIV